SRQPEHRLGALRRLERSDGVLDGRSLAAPEREVLGLRAQGGRDRLVAVRRGDEVEPRLAVEADDLDAADLARWVAPSERHGRGDPAVELDRELHELGIALHRLVPSDRAGDAAHADDLPADEPAQLVELVHAHVDDDSAARARIPERA